MPELQTPEQPVKKEAITMIMTPREYLIAVMYARTENKEKRQRGDDDSQTTVLRS